MIIQAEWKQEDGLYKCPICGKEFALTALVGHVKRAHYEEYKQMD